MTFDIEVVSVLEKTLLFVEDFEAENSDDWVITLESP